MNKTARVAYKESDKQLNEIYQTILSAYQTDSVFIDNLKKSQRIWIRFRNAEMAMKYPDYSVIHYGSIQPTCEAYYLKELTDQRIKTLKIWVRGVAEGETCNGSVKIIPEIDAAYMQKALIQKDSSIWLTTNMKKDHRIIGYKSKDLQSTKMILLSIFTNEVENNPFECVYGAYYETNEMKDLKLKYVATEKEFLKIAILQQGKIIDQVYMLKKCFEFEA
nr:lysozyme inhibitor LprI family protein [Putridiphycobacter roseus]